jgi:hypothetical protein
VIIGEESKFEQRQWRRLRSSEPGKEKNMNKKRAFRPTLSRRDFVKILAAFGRSRRYAFSNMPMAGL